MAAPAFRRRILIEPAPGCVSAELEDDWHRMAVIVRHEGGIAHKVEGDMLRWPWTTCRGAIAQLSATFDGYPLAEFARRGAKSRNCTHLHDLAVFAAGHADETAAIAYDVTVTDPVDDQRVASIVRDGAQVMAWTLGEMTLLAPAELAGLTLFTLNDWIASLDPSGQETARILRWAAILALGRAIDMPEGMSGLAFANGSCFTFQPDVVSEAFRRPNVPRDFSRIGDGPLANKSRQFFAQRRAAITLAPGLSRSRGRLEKLAKGTRKT